MTISEPTHRRGQVVDDQILAAVIVVIEKAGTLSQAGSRTLVIPLI